MSVEHSERFEERMIENGGNVGTWYVEDRAHVDAMWSDSKNTKIADFILPRCIWNIVLDAGNQLKCDFRDISIMSGDIPPEACGFILLAF